VSDGNFALQKPDGGLFSRKHPEKPSSKRRNTPPGKTSFEQEEYDQESSAQKRAPGTERKHLGAYKEGQAKSHAELQTPTNSMQIE
jgi:hypothetical protein